MAQLLTPEALLSLLTLTILEIVLGIDNIIFISILSGKLPKDQQKRAQQIGLLLAMFTRVLLLCSLNYIMQLVTPLFNMSDWIGITHTGWIEKLAISGKDLILIAGGIFLIYKSTHEIHQKLENDQQPEKESNKKQIFSAVIVQIILLDIVFSLDSVITAIGMADHLEIMIAAVVIAVIIMLTAASKVSDFVNKHPSVKMLALSFLLLIGVSLLVEGFEHPIPKGYIYFAMAFSMGVELLNLKSKKKSEN